MSPRGDAGSAVAEFVMVSGLLLHVRTVLTAAVVQEGARAAANACRSVADGAQVTRRAIRDAPATASRGACA